MTTPASPATNSRIDAEGLERFRRQLTAYCYQMLGSAFEAEDAVQEVMLRAVRAGYSFEGRSTLQTWLYRIATNVCVDMLRGRSRRACPIGLTAPSRPVHGSLGPPLSERAWITPVADARILPDNADPAEIATAREAVRLAFITALHCLPSRQRAALLLCQVLRFEAGEAAQILGVTVAAVNSALHRARAALAALPVDDRPADVTSDHAQLLAHYVDAFERYDISKLVGLLHDDVVQSMPPFAMWLSSAHDIGAWMVGPGSECRSSRLLTTGANGCPAFGQYRADPLGGHAPWALTVLEISAGRVARIHSFLDAGTLFALFGLPAHLPGPSIPAPQTTADARACYSRCSDHCTAARYP